MRFASDTDTPEAVRLSAERFGFVARVIRSTKVAISDQGVEHVARELYRLSDRNSHEYAGFCEFKDLPPHVRDVWTAKARSVLYVVLDNTQISEVG